MGAEKGAEMIRGFDVSFWQDNIDWDKAAKQDSKFCFIKASQDTTADTQFARNWKEAKRVGFLRGAYHFADYRTYAVPQAQYMWSLLKDDPGELPPVLDLEQYWTPLPPGSRALAWVKDWGSEMSRLCGSKPILYTSPSVIKYWLATIPDWLKEWPLWIANYGVSEPGYSPWPKWTLWQYSTVGPGTAYGMQSLGLDMDWFNGSLEELQAFCGKKPEPKPLPTLEVMVEKLWAAHPELH